MEWLWFIDRGQYDAFMDAVTPENMDTYSFGPQPHHLPMTPLAAASRRGNVALISWLLKRGANPNTQDPVHHWTPLHEFVYFTLGASYASMECIALLCKAGANTELESNRRETPLEAAVWRSIKGPIRALLEHDARACPLMPQWAHTLVAARNHCRSIARLIVGLRRARQPWLLGALDRGVVMMIARAIFAARQR